MYWSFAALRRRKGRGQGVIAAAFALFSITAFGAIADTSGLSRYSKEQIERGETRGYCHPLQAHNIYAPLNKVYRGGRNYYSFENGPTEKYNITRPKGIGTYECHRLKPLNIGMPDHREYVIYNNVLYLGSSAINFSESFKGYARYSTSIGVSDNFCNELPEIRLFMNINSEKDDFLRDFYLNHGRELVDTIDVVGKARKLQCAEELQPNFRIEIYAVERKKKSVERNGQTLELHLPVTVQMYGGYVDFSIPHSPYWVDDNLSERKKFVERWKRYTAMRYERRQEQRQKTNEFLGQALGFGVGLIQGVTYEFSDEGVCGFLSIVEDGDDRSQYVACHNLLNDLLERLKGQHEMAYVVGNLLGMLNTSYDSYIESGKSKSERVKRAAQVECLEGVLTEIGKLRIGEDPEARVLAEGCILGAGIGAAAQSLGK